MKTIPMPENLISSILEVPYDKLISASNDELEVYYIKYSFNTPEKTTFKQIKKLSKINKSRVLFDLFTSQPQIPSIGIKCEVVYLSLTAISKTSEYDDFLKIYSNVMKYSLNDDAMIIWAFEKEKP